MMLENNAKLAYKIAVEKQESVLFDDTDQDNEEERVTFAHTGGKNLLRNDTVDDLTQVSSNHQDGSGKIKAVKLVDKTKRAFSISIESSKAFELAIRKPRRKWKHYITRIRAYLYGVFLLLMKHHGKPPARQDVTIFLVVLAGVLGFDVLLLANFCFHISLPPSNFAAFGWAFVLTYPLVPFLSPLMAIAAAITGSPNLLKSVGNLNATMILVNLPLTVLLAYLNHDDPQYLLMLTLMAFVKVAISGVTAKVVQHLINPRYEKNQQKLKKILKRQSEKLALREEIIGKEVSNQIDEGEDLTLGFPLQESLVDVEVQEQMKQYLLEK